MQDQVTWADALSAWSMFATAALTLLLLVAAGVTAYFGWGALRASRDASDAARAANEQARIDSIEQSRPYVFVEVIPGLAAVQSFDLRVSNTGRTAARELTFTYEQWPEGLDDIAESIRSFFDTPRTLPPGCSIRVVWRLQGEFADGTREAGMTKTAGTVTASYGSDDPGNPSYRDTYDIRIENSGLWPVPENGPEPKRFANSDLQQIHSLGRVIARRIGEITR